MHVSKTYSFDAAHVLPRHPGKCREMHGHTWHVELDVFGEPDKDQCFVKDYNDLDALVKPIIACFDHKVLNSFVRYPSSENIAIHFAYLLMPSIPEWQRFFVCISETPKTWARFDSGEDMHLIFDADENAEWKSPDPSLATGALISTTLQNVEAALPELEKKYLEALMVRDQLRLYRDSIKPMSDQEKQIFAELRNKGSK